MGSLYVLLCIATIGSATVINIADHGVIRNDPKSGPANQVVLRRLLQNASNGDQVLVPEGLFYSQGGIIVTGIVNVTLDIRGTLVADPNIDSWPMDSSNSASYLHFLQFVDCSHITITGTGGMVEGNGIGWWNRMILPQVFGELKGHRPKLVQFVQSTDLLIENFRMHNSPSFHLQLIDVARAEVRNITITVDRQHQQQLKGNMSALSGTSAPWLKLQPWDLNTDGIDPQGRDIWIHDCSILNDDDSIAVKPCGTSCKYSNCSENMLIENMVMTGFGASIGSVPPSVDHHCVRNITFRKISMPQTGKGIYIKSNPSCDDQNGVKVSAEITNIVYEDIDIIEPRWWPIWIGPQQQHEPNSALGDKCAIIYPISGHCPTQGCVDFQNITLRNIHVTKPWMSPGVILGNVSNPIQGLQFWNVTFDKPGMFPYKRKYKCENAHITADASTMPIPEC